MQVTLTQADSGTVVPLPLSNGTPPAPFVSSLKNIPRFRAADL
jgi:hypothetical protein